MPLRGWKIGEIVHGRRPGSGVPYNGWGGRGAVWQFALSVASSQSPACTAEEGSDQGSSEGLRKLREDAETIFAAAEGS